MARTKTKRTGAGRARTARRARPDAAPNASTAPGPGPGAGPGAARCARPAPRAGKPVPARRDASPKRPGPKRENRAGAGSRPPKPAAEPVRADPAEPGPDRPDGSGPGGGGPGEDGEGGWVSKAQLLAVLDVSRSYFERDIRPRIPESQIRRAGPGRPLRFHGRSVLEAWAARRLARGIGAGETPADPLLAGAVSPALEEYRQERAMLARLERLEREAELLPRDATHAMLAQVAALLRDAGLILQRQFGPEAHAVLDEALDGAEREIASFFGEESETGDRAEPSLPARREQSG